MHTQAPVDFTPIREPHLTEKETTMQTETAAEILTLEDGYSRLKNPPIAQYRYMTPDEAKALRAGQRVPFLDVQGKARELKINGKPRTWKRDASRVEVPVKYGMYEYGTFDAYRDHMMSAGGAILLVKVA